MDDGTAPVIDAGAITRLLAQPARLQAVAALVLGAETIAEVRIATALPLRTVVDALHRLVAGGLVIVSGDGHHFVVEEAFGAAARATMPTGDDEHADAPKAGQGVLRAFVRNGRLTAIPTGHSKRQVILDLLAQEFEIGRHYSEREVNRLLRTWHDDTAALRRYLVDDGFLSRADGEYWRSGGSTTPL